MNSSVSPKDEIWFLRVCHHISTGLYLNWSLWHTSYGKFYICVSVRRNSSLRKSNEMQLYADIYLLLNYSTCFGRPSRPSSGVHKSVVAASGTDHTIWGASFFKRDQIIVLIWSRLKKLAPQIVWLYQRLQIPLYVLLMMDTMDARNM